MENKDTEEIYVGNGIWDWIKEAEPVTLKVEDVYEWTPSRYWSILDELFEDRPDLHDRIEKFKKTKRSNI